MCTVAKWMRHSAIINIVKRKSWTYCCNQISYTVNASHVGLKLCCSEVCVCAWERRRWKKSRKMADLEAVLADVSYLMAMEKSKCTPAARASKKIILPDPRYVQIMLAHFGEILRDWMLKRQLSFIPMHHFCKKTELFIPAFFIIQIVKNCKVFQKLNINDLLS